MTDQHDLLEWRIKTLYATAIAWRFVDADGEPDLSEMRREQAAEFEAWLIEHDRAVARRHAARLEQYSREQYGAVFPVYAELADLIRREFG